MGNTFSFVASVYTAFVTPRRRTLPRSSFPDQVIHDTTRSSDNLSFIEPKKASILVKPEFFNRMATICTVNRCRLRFTISRLRNIVEKAYVTFSNRDTSTLNVPLRIPCVAHVLLPPQKEIIVGSWSLLKPRSPFYRNPTIFLQIN
ncbi:uncharacterized protein LOC143427161 [Xylocopa sonorina]|uniref:uncharacterized protein LOC143427161 n=1 Tax=Xylocopa sonorina TaxID=1818115 RepID=UPI00403B32F6